MVNRPRRRLLTALLLAAISASVLGVGPAGAGGSKVYAIQNCLHAKPKPTALVFYCADHGAYTDPGLKWPDWGKPSAHATGVVNVKTCDPDCISGPTESFPVEITLYNIQRWHCGRVEGRFYKSVRLKFPAAHPDFFGHPPRHLDCFRSD